MNEVFHFNKKLRTTLIVAILADIFIAYGQTEKRQHFPIPEDIFKIFQTSCMQCHGSNSGRFPKSRLNFSRWTVYSAEKEVEKSSSICSSVRKGTMPPKSISKSHPELIPTREQIDLICKWAEALKSKKKGK
jgi:mono/diheme cytochrome c family protein